MVAGPVVGYFIGNWLDNRLGSSPYLMVVFIFLGLAASGREVYRLLKQASQEDNDRKDADDKIRP